ncbi:hypothetical protein ACFL5O_05805 [Myxococcota bacterium]
MPGGGASGASAPAGGAAAGGAARGGTVVGGRVETGGAQTGASGASASSGSAATDGISAEGASGALGASLAAFCAGEAAKASYRGQVVRAQSASFESDLVFDCCSAHGVYVRTARALGFDFAIDVVTEVGAEADSTYALAESEWNVRASVRATAEPRDAAHRAGGEVRIMGGRLGSELGQLGLCLQIDEPSSELDQTTIYVPSVPILPNVSGQRLQFYLLEDSSITATEAAQLALDSLALSASPLLDLRRIVMLEQSEHWIVLNPNYNGDMLRTQIGDVPVHGLPFVAVADDVPIYLGSFTTLVSSVRPIGPFVMLEEIEKSGFRIEPPFASEEDPRADRRILKVLTETGKLAP